jgi:hypothetical protein
MLEEPGPPLYKHQGTALHGSILLEISREKHPRRGRGFFGCSGVRYLFADIRRFFYKSYKMAQR